MDDGLLCNVISFLVIMSYFFGRPFVIKYIPEWLDYFIVIILAFAMGWNLVDVINLYL
ncbi:MAG: hypothetical protein VX263_02710 [Bacteroidota bacterium]|jgi:hypothetical protein|nr:hypothetical protein [Bacteroidota bacterium]|tara:strand:+ start:750 stop:923 length:174 start_codon:yes stop_codon:yes gene_type:complete